MTYKELTDYKDVFGHLPKKYNQKYNRAKALIPKKSLDFGEHFPATRTLIKDTGERPVNKVLNRMKTMTIVFYAISLVGVIIQATDIVPGIPDRITFSVIVGGLVAANIIQWRQAIKDRETNRQEIGTMIKDHRVQLAKMHTDMMVMVENNQEAIQEILKELKS